VVDIPPLRSRNGDAMLLAHAFLRRFAQDQRRGSLSFGDDAIRAIESHAWPGNVRELLSAVKRAAIMADGNRVGRDDLGLFGAGDASEVAEAPSLDLRGVREKAERGAVVSALARTGGNVAKAADILGVSRPTLYDLLNRLAIKT
jgi:two-component system, NtrC family, response regulator